MSGLGSLTIQSGASLAISSTATHDFNQRAITNNGTVTWSGGQLRTGNSGSFTNASGATFTDTASNSINNAYGGIAGTFANNGTYNKTATGTTNMQVSLSNALTVNIQAGTLELDAGGSNAAGATFAISSRAT